MSKNLNFIKYFSLLDIKNELIKLGFKSHLDFQENVGRLRKNKVRIEKDDVCFKLLGGSLRLISFYQQLFEKGEISCSCCNKKAHSFALRAQNDILNLELVDEHNNLFTHDHTKARSLGGKDRLDNVTIMCYHCNSAKNILYENKTHALYKGEANEINYEEIKLLSKSLTI